MEETLEFRRSRAKHFGMLLVSAAFVACGWGMIASADDPGDRITGWFVAGFFALCGLVFIRDLVRGGTAFTFNRSGIIADNFDGLIPWEEIASCAVLTIHGNRMLAITFRDPERFLVRISAAGRKLTNLNERMGWGHWALQFTGINPGIDQALAWIRTNVPRIEVR